MVYAEIDDQTAQPNVLLRSERFPSSGWKILQAVLLGLVILPLAFAARVNTQMVMETGFGPHLPHYFTAMSIALAFHVVMAYGVYIMLTDRFQRVMLNIGLLQMVIGYGLASALFTVTIW